ncbi:nuclear transport factor 2 family protein [Hymenobacter lutimineralis]|uniref:Nuclear transport factor 2 family protein n=1 Tax=Hymenobacter lutimineralis TaxID=2606448 RepID=A0A5D6UU76_9BACT|nr:nuclear transport factor 2 family protein [Hymenobacter lutimineralis]TYZ07043.1 nuclear transport factor 2 family protein [Hymenobacter lutimineralis]
MKRLLLLVPVLLVAGSALAQRTSADPALLEKIRRLDLAHAQAIFRSDAAALDSLMNDDVSVNHPTNRIVKEKKELLGLIKQGVIRYSAFERTPESFLFFKDMVVVMGGEVVVPAKGAPNAGQKLRRRYTNIWLLQDGKWKLSVRHANNVCAGN